MEITEKQNRFSLDIRFVSFRCFSFNSIGDSGLCAKVETIFVPAVWIFSFFGGRCQHFYDGSRINNKIEFIFAFVWNGFSKSNIFRYFSSILFFSLLKNNRKMYSVDWRFCDFSFFFSGALHFIKNHFESIDWVVRARVNSPFFRFWFAYCLAATSQCTLDKNLNREMQKR